MNSDKQISPSAFIPYCEFGGNMFSMGVKIDQFELPVCNSFEATILNDQLCYKIDLEKYADDENVEDNLKLGFNFILDYNEDRQVKFDEKVEDNIQNISGLARSILDSNQDQQATIYLNTIGKYQKHPHPHFQI